MILDTQAIQALLMTLGISVGVVLVLALSFLAAVAAWRRYDRRARVSALERYLAVVAGWRPQPRPRSSARSAGTG